ncbi:MAG TPA: response regulator [Pyrinomonadaceae bacterium]|nr:response regulator [Pyrinomonadaceae bacterium]
MAATILIADDYEDNLELLRLMLEAGSYRVREARDGRQCVTMALAEPPDLIMIDLSMPLLDGWGVLKELQNDERTKTIPCVAVTAYGDSDRERALQTGFDAYVAKPFRSAELLQVVSSLIGTGKTKSAAPSLERADLPAL